MIAETTEWQGALKTWLTPFLACLHHEHQRRWAPVYLAGLLGPGPRKSVSCLAERVAPGAPDQLHHFIAVAPWDTAVMRQVLMAEADTLVGHARAFLVVDETAWAKKGTHSVGVARQWCGRLGKTENCPVAVSLTLAQGEVPVPIALDLYLPKEWANDAARRQKAGIPAGVTFAPKWKLALAQIRSAVMAGVRFGTLLADGGFGSVAAFRKGLDALGLRWAVGIARDLLVYPADVRVDPPVPTGEPGRPPTKPQPNRPAVAAEAMIAGLDEAAWQAVMWRTGTKGELSCRCAAVRVRVADGPAYGGGRHLPGREAWLLAEQRSDGRTKYYLSNLPRQVTRKYLLATIKSRWVCEQGHQQMKEELGLDHYEGRSWQGVHHHMLASMMAMAFLQHRRLAGEKRGP